MEKLNSGYTYDDIIKIIDGNNFTVESKSDNRIICSDVKIGNIAVDKVHFVFMNEKLDSVYVINKKVDTSEEFNKFLQNKFKYDVKTSR